VVLFISFLFPQILPGKIWNVDTLGSEGDSLQKYISIAHEEGGTVHVFVYLWESVIGWNLKS